MRDTVFDAFLDAQRQAAEELNERSDLLTVLPFGRNRFVLEFRCKGLIRTRDGTVREGSEFHVGLRFPPDYLRHVNPLQVVTWLYPANVWHPNVRPPAVCLGHIAPGTPLVDLAFHLYEMIALYNYATHDALNAEAAQWLRNHGAELELPLDRRPLLRRALELEVDEHAAEELG